MGRILDRAGWAIAGAATIALVGVVAGVVRAGPLDPPGPPGSTAGVRLPGTPLTQPASFPIAISQPGSYYLAENITGVSGQNGIVISTGNVTLDLNGFTLKGVASSLDGINVSGSLENVVIGNGTVTAWGGDGVDVGSSTRGAIHDIIASNNGLTGFGLQSANLQLSDCQAYGNYAGATVSGNSNLVTRCSFDRNQAQGLIVSGNGNNAVDNVADGNGTGCSCTGFWVYGQTNRIEHNSAMFNNNYGFWFDGYGNIAVANFANSNLNGAFGAQYNITINCVDCDIGALNTAGNAPNYWANIDR